MKKIFNVLFVIIVNSSTFLFAHEFYDSDKIYIDSKSVMIANNGIFINVDGYINVINTLSYDETGLYVRKEAWIDREGHYNTKPECPTCGDVNKTWAERERNREAERDRNRENERNQNRDRDNNKQTK